MTFLLEYMYVTRLTGVPNDLSEEYLNFVTDSVSGQRKDGDFFHNIDKGYSTWGIVPEAVVPYAASPVTTIAQPTLDRGRGWTRFRAQFLKTWDNSRGASDSEIAAATASLDRQIPVACGSWWPTRGNWSVATVKGVEVMSVPAATQKGTTMGDGHSVVLVGYRKDPDFAGGGYFVFRNSWVNDDGTPWGDQGHGYMPFEYLRRFANDLVVYNTVPITGARLGPQALVAQKDRIDVVASDSSGRVHGAAWQQNMLQGRWRAWWSILGGRVRGNSLPSMVARDSNRLDVFGVGTDGGIYTAAWDARIADGQWRGWWRIPNGVAAPESSVCSVSRHVNKLDVFMVGTDGGVYTAAWDQNVDSAKWRGWWRITNGKALAKNGLAAVARDANKLDVFAVAPDGGIYTAAWDQNVDSAKWRGWWRIGNSVAASATNISAVTRDPKKLDLFMIGSDGGIYTAAWESGVADGKWRGWWRILNGVAMAGSSVCAVARSPGKLDVFVVGTDGGVYTAAWDQAVADAKWRGWWRVGDLTAQPSGGLAVVARDPSKLDVFATGRDGRVYTAAWDQHVANAQWRGWWRVEP
jgi:hypothetical protein